MLLCKNRRLFTVAGDNFHVLTPIPMHLIPIPIPFPSHGWSYSHSHGNPMGPMGSQSFPFPCTPLPQTQYWGYADNGKHWTTVSKQLKLQYNSCCLLWQPTTGSLQSLQRIKENNSRMKKFCMWHSCIENWDATLEIWGPIYRISLRQSYDNAEVTIDLWQTSNLQNILRRAQGFS